MKWIEKALDILTLGLFVALLSSLLDFSLVMKETMVAGGDMISHPAIVDGLKQQWSRGQFWAWNHGWFGGFPNLYYYFYPVYILAAGLGLIGFSDVVAFKMSVAAVVLSVPCVTFYFGRRWLSYPVALLLTSGMLVLFLNEMDSRSGGNLKSLLAGQISHEVGLVWLAVLFGYLARQKMTGIGAALALSMVVLSHVYTAMFGSLLVAAVFCFDLLKQRNFKIIKQYTSVLWAIGMTAFFWVPFVYYRAFTVAPINHSAVTIDMVLSLMQIKQPLYVLMYVSAGLGFLWLGYKRQLSAVYCGALLVALTSTVAMPFLDGTPILHIRIPAQVYLLALMLMVLLVHKLARRDSLQWLLVAPLALLYLQSFVPSVALDAVLPKFVRTPVVEAPAWWQWNMSGIENKDNSDDVMSLWSFLRMTDTKDFRLAVEYGDYNHFGSPRIFEMTYAVTKKPILEGLLLESSVLYPSYFYASFFLVPTTWWPGFPVQVPPPDAKKGIEYFSRFHVGYYVAATADVKNKLTALGYPSIYKNDTFEVFQVNQDSSIASVVQGDVPVVASPRPLYESVLNYPVSLDTIIALQKNMTGAGLKDFTEKPQQKLIPLKTQWSEDGQSLEVYGIQAAAIDSSEAASTALKKLFIKIPYFPNWKVLSGEKVQVATPNMMLVETDKDQITLAYGPGWPEKLSGLVSLVSWVVFLYFAMLKLRQSFGVIFGSTVRTSHSRR